MSDRTVPPFHGNISFNAQHSPMGAFFSFTCGQFGSRGGFGLQSGKPGNQNIYIGVKDGDRFSDSPLKCLPFFEGADADEAARFDVEKKSTGEKRPSLISYSRDEVTRHYGYATDKWVTKDLEFAIYTSFGTVPSLNASDFGQQWPFPELEQRYRTLPAVVATLSVDNRKGHESKTAVFAIKFPDAGIRIVDRGLDLAAGFISRDTYGVAGQVIRNGNDASPEAPMLHNNWDIDEALRGLNPIHLLGNMPGMSVTVPAGEMIEIRLVFATLLPGVVTSGIKGSYWYLRYQTDLMRVMNAAFRHIDQLIEDAATCDAELLTSKLSPDQQFMIAHATRSYYGSTQLLDVGGEPFWVVNEGEYCMLNTLDLSVDHVFWELKQNPWVVKNLLDNFVRHYSYVDTVGGPGEPKTRPGGISFCHDMGVHNNFSPRGNSSYELPNLNAACFSYMTAEQLCNWILIAASYVAKTRDVEWARQNQHIIDACYQSLVNRGGETGFCQYDSSRCGPGGAEITTYDSLDHSLAQTRNNLYMAVKTWASFLGIQKLFGSLGLAESNHDRYNEPMQYAYRIAKAVMAQVQPDGTLPAVFERDNAGFQSRILPAIEGLIYPLYWESIDTLKPHGTFADLLAVLKKHTEVLLKSGTNLFPDGGIKLSSTSNNSWMSKIAIFMHVCRKVFKLDEDPAIKAMFAKADAAHVKWQTEGESAYWACSDQFVNGVAKGSKYYPRIITAALWMEK